MTNHWKLYEHGSYKGRVAVNTRGAGDPLKPYRARARARLAQMKENKKSALFAADESNREFRLRIAASKPSEFLASSATGNLDADAGEIRAKARADAKAACTALKSKPDGVYSGINESNAQYRSRIGGIATAAPVVIASDNAADCCAPAYPFCTSRAVPVISYGLSESVELCRPLTPQRFYGGSFNFDRAVRFGLLMNTPDIDTVQFQRTIRAFKQHRAEHTPVLIYLVAQQYSAEPCVYGNGLLLALHDGIPHASVMPTFTVRDGLCRVATASRQHPLSSTIEVLNAVVRAREAVLHYFDAVPKREAPALPTTKYMAEAGNDLFETAVAVATHPSRPFTEVCEALGHVAGKSADSFAERGNTLVNIGYAKWTSPDDADKSRAILLSEAGKHAVKETLSTLSATAASLNPALARDVDTLSQRAMAALN